MSLPLFSEFISEATMHGPVQHKALLQTHVKDMEDAPDHETSGEERLSLLRHHEGAVNEHYHDMYRYTKNSKRINHALVSNDPHHMQVGGIQGHHDSLMEMHSKAPALHQDVHAYSSLGSFNPTEHIEKSGGVFSTPAHTSTSINPHIASAHGNFHHMMDNVKDHHVIHFHLPKGSKCGTYIGAYSDQPHEQEFLIKSGAKFHITGSEKHDLGDGRGRTIWHAKPHADHLHEATYHDPNIFRSIEHRETPNRERTGDHYAFVKASKTDVQADVQKQHAELSEKVPYGRLIHTNVDFTDKDHHDNIKKYTFGSYPVNRALIHEHVGMSSDEAHVRPQHHENLEIANKLSTSLNHIAKPIESEMHVYSGISSDHVHSLESANGVVHTPAFTSTSIDPEKAAKFAHKLEREGSPSTGESRIRMRKESHILHFKLPKGYNKGAYVAPMSAAEHEREFLLDKGQTWKVTNKKTVSQRFTHSSKADNNPGFVQTHHTHIWTLEPHSSSLKEATYHDPDVFRSIKHTDTPNKKRTEQHSDLVKKTNEKMSNDVNKQHKKLSSGNLLSRFLPDRKGLAHLRKYTFNSKDMNHALVNEHSSSRGKSASPQSAFHSDHLEEANRVSKALGNIARPLKSETHVYSGISVPHAKDLHTAASISGVIHTPAFTSTSIDPHRATKFAQTSTLKADVSANRANTIKDSHILHFKLPKGYNKGAYIAPHSQAEHEQEFLLDKGQHWKITNRETISSRSAHKNGHGSGEVSTTRTHIWTLEPHDTHLHEVYHHDPSYFRGFSIVGAAGKESSNLSSNPELYGHGDTPTSRHYNSSIEEFHARTSDEVKKHHNHLMANAPKNSSSYQYLHASANDREREAQFHHDNIKHNDALHAYTKYSASMSHALLRKHRGKSRDDDHLDLHQADQVSAAIAHHAVPADHEIHVYSGLKHDALLHAHKSGQGVIHTPAFTSTTINPNAATGFSTNLLHKHISGDQGTGVTGVNHVAHFKLPKGYKKGVYVAGVSAHPHEKEYLLDKGQNWKITGHKRVTRTNTSKRYGHYKEVEHTHIWTLEPHDGPAPSGGKIHESEDKTKKLDEAVRHSEHFFSGTMGFDKVHGHSALVKHTGDGGRIDFTHDHEEMQKQHASLRNSHKVVDADAAHIIKKYTGNSAAVNKHLIAPKALSFLGQDHSRHAHLMSEAIQRHAKPLRHDVHVYSGLGNHNPTKDFDKTGTVHLPAFTSTSLNPTVALAFGPDKPKKQETHILHFHLPKGYKKSLYVAGHSAVKDEREMLLDKGQKWQLTSVKRSRVKVEYGKNVRGEQDHHRNVTVWSLRPHHSQLNEALVHDASQLHDAHPEGKSFKTQATEMPHDPDRDNSHVVQFGFLADKANRVKSFREHVDTQKEAAHLQSRAEEHAAVHGAHLPKYERAIFDNHTSEYTHRYVNQALHSYTEISEDMNEHLLGKATHGHGSPYAKQHESNAAFLSENIKAHAAPLTQTHHMYSGLKHFDPSEHFKKNAGVIHMPAFTSASINPHIATNFDHPGRQADHHIMHFELPAGYNKGAYIGHHSEHPHEQEFLLDKGQSWKLKSHQAVETHDTTWGEGEIVKRHIWTVTPHEDK